MGRLATLFHNVRFLRKAIQGLSETMAGRSKGVEAGGHACFAVAVGMVHDEPVELSVGLHHIADMRAGGRSYAVHQFGNHLSS